MRMAELEDTMHERRKAEIIAILKRLIEQVEGQRMYGEFGVTFSAQAGKIGHFEETVRRSYK